MYRNLILLWHHNVNNKNTYKPMQAQNEGQGEEKNSWWMMIMKLWFVHRGFILIKQMFNSNHKGLDAWQKKDQQRWDFSGYS